MDNIEKIRCILDGNRGIYLPQAFAGGFDMKAWHVKKADAKLLLSDPARAGYWETWDDVLGYAWLKDGKHKWTLSQDGDLFACRDDYDADIN